MLLTEAHRTLFFFGALQALLAMIWWMLDLGGRYVGLYVHDSGPTWLGAPKTPRIAFVPAAALMAAGLILSYAGLAAARPLAAAGAFLHAAGWLWALGALVRMLVGHWNPNARLLHGGGGFSAAGVPRRLDAHGSVLSMYVKPRVDART